jgi:phage regulator Rha-like protein
VLVYSSTRSPARGLLFGVRELFFEKIKIFSIFDKAESQVRAIYRYGKSYFFINFFWFTEPCTDKKYGSVTMENGLIPIEKLIYEIRGYKVMFDSDLARLYEVELKRLNQSVKRNIKRFPQEFMFQLTDEEWKYQRSQIVTFNKNIRKYRPFVFTEHGILMLSSVLNSDRAVEVNIQIMKIFVKMRQYAFSQTETNEQIAELRKLLLLYIDKNDKRVNDIIVALNNLIEKPKEAKKIGFRTD